MAGEFLPPVVTELTGNIDDLRDKIAEAKALIASLKDSKVTIKVDLDTTAFTRAMSAIQTIARQGITVPVHYDANLAAFTSGLANAQSIARSGITIPVRYDYTPFAPGPFTASGASDNASWWAARNAFSGMQGYEYGNSGLGGYRDASGGGGGFFGGLAAGAAGAWAGRPFQQYPTTTFPAPWFFGGGRMGYTATHLGLLGAGALGMGIAGGIYDLGAAAAVTGRGAAAFYNRASLLDQSVSATIPPGVPDYALARTFGLNNVGPNSPLVRASQIGNGMVLSAAGGLVGLANKQGVFGQLVANQGLSTSSTIDNIIARAELATQHPQTLARGLSNISTDASNLGAFAANTLAFTGHAFSHMPGEIEWLTTGLRNASSWANDIWKTPGLNSIAGDTLFGGLLLHSTMTGAHLLGGGLNLLGNLPGIPAGLGGTAAIRSATAADVAAGRAATVGEKVAGTGLMGAGLFNPYVLGAAALVGTGLAAYRYQTPTSAAIGALNAGIGLGKTGPINAGSFAQNIGPSLGLFMNGSANGSTGMSYLGNLLNNPQGKRGTTPGVNMTDFQLAGLGPLMTVAGWFGGSSAQRDVGNFLTFGLLNKELDPAQQNYIASQNAANTLLAYGGNINAVASSLGVSTAVASNILSQSGAKVGKGGVQGGNAMAVRLAQNFLNGNRINTGGTAQALMNIGVGTTVNDSAWKAATQINANWDAYMGAMTSGGSGLGGIFNALQGTRPLLPGGDFYTASGAMTQQGQAVSAFINTNQAISGSANPMADFFRQAQSVGAIGGKSTTNTFAQMAASLAPLAGASKQAQQELVALANEGGGHFKNMAQVMKAAGGTAAAALVNLSNSTATTTANMAHLGPFASTVMQKLQNDTTSALAAIIQKSPQATNAFKNLVGQIAQGSPNSQKAKQDIASLTSYLESHGMTYQQIADVFKQMGINLNAIPGNKTITITVVGRISGNSAVVQAALASGNYAGGQLKATLPGHAAGTDAAPPGWAWVGEQGPELMHFSGGEVVIPHNMATRGYAGGVGLGSFGAPVVIMLDGKEIWSNAKGRTYQYNVNNGNRDSQGRVAGNVRPR